MGEHDDDLEIGEPGARAAEIHMAAAIASGLERIAVALEHGLHELASALAADTKRGAGRRHARRSA